MVLMKQDSSRSQSMTNEPMIAQHAGISGVIHQNNRAKPPQQLPPMRKQITP